MPPSASTAAPPSQAELVRVTRGNAIDSIHYGSVAVVDADGRLLYSAGDPQRLTTTRSALKPLQALPFVAAGGLERFGYSSAQAALLCASHSGEPRHVEAVADMLSRAQCTPDELQCGVQAPIYYAVRGECPPPLANFSALHHNCSGKHSGMLAHCRQCGLPLASYLDFDHPLQRSIRAAVSHMTGVAEADLVAGIDGCSAPNYAVPLDRLAHAFARLASSVDDEMYGTAPARLAAAMIAHPEMVSGEGRSDLAFMRAGRGDWVTKVGAEAVQAIGIRSRGWGIALKAADGNSRGLHAATVAALDQLGLLDDARRAELSPWSRTEIRNYRGLLTGWVEPLLALQARG